MRFGEKLRAKRKECGLTQAELAKKAGLALKTIANYENNSMYPKKRETYKILAEVLNVENDYFDIDNGGFVEKAKEEYGKRGSAQARRLVEEVSTLFSGGEMAEEDMEEMMLAIQDAFWKAKKNNRKYVPQKYRED